MRQCSAIHGVRPAGAEMELALNGLVPSHGGEAGSVDNAVKGKHAPPKGERISIVHLCQPRKYLE